MRGQVIWNLLWPEPGREEVLIRLLVLVVFRVFPRLLGSKMIAKLQAAESSRFCAVCFCRTNSKRLARSLSSQPTNQPETS